jgi:hypothetical protein
VNCMCAKRFAPEQRLTPTVSPSAVETRREREGVARVDSVNGKERRAFACNAFGEYPRRTDTVGIAGERVTERNVLR